MDLEKEMDRYFETMEVKEHENIFESTFQKIARHFFELGIKAQKGGINYDKRRIIGIPYKGGNKI